MKTKDNKLSEFLEGMMEIYIRCLMSASNWAQGSIFFLGTRTGNGSILKKI
jgi:hypothetical protein